MSFANFIIMIGGFAQNIVGRILDYTWDGHVANGIRVYSQHSYQLALTIIPAGLLLASICTYFLKETYQKEEPVKLSDLQSTHVTNSFDDMQEQHSI